MCGNIPYVCVFCVQRSVVHPRMDPLQVCKSSNNTNLSNFTHDTCYVQCKGHSTSGLLPCQTTCYSDMCNTLGGACPIANGELVHDYAC